MRIAVDARPAAFPERTGVGWYTWHLLRLLPVAMPEDRFLAWYLNARMLAGGPRRLLPELAGPRLREVPVPFPSRWFEVSSQRWGLPRIEWTAPFDVLFAPNFVPPPTRSERVVITVHDLAFARFPDTAPHGTRWWLRQLDGALARAARVLTVSEATKADLVERFAVEPARIAVTPLGVDRSMFRPARAEEVE